MRVVRFILAVVLGMAAGSLTVMVVESLSSFMHPLPEGLDPYSTAPEQKARFAEHVKGLPQSAFVMLLVGWSLGSLASAFVGRSLAPDRSAWPGLLTGGFILAATIMMLFMFGHVLWLNIAAPICCVIFTLLGLGLAAPREHLIQGSLKIRAPLEKVFRTLATAEEFSRAIPDIKKIEFLTDKHYGAGTRFRETRLMGRSEAVAELTVGELVENERVRIAGIMAGTEWDTLFRVVPAGKETAVQLETTARPRGFFARLVVPLMLGMVRKAILGDLDSVRRYCESASS
jgi:carbon monoxide dehydrogenase subunit G